MYFSSSDLSTSLQDRVGLQIASCLSHQVPSESIQTRLENARTLALAHHMQRPMPAFLWQIALMARLSLLWGKLVHHVSPVSLQRPLASSTGMAPFAMTSSNWWHRARVSTRSLPLVLLLSGVILAGHLQENQKIEDLAQTDLALLSDNLPAQAYADPRFMSYLRSQE